MISVAFIGRSVLLHRSGKETVFPIPVEDSDEAWAKAFRDALKTIGARRDRVVLGLSGEHVAILHAPGPEEAFELLAEVAHLFQCDPQEVVISRDGPSVCAVQRTTIEVTCRRLERLGLRPLRIDATCAAIIRSAATEGVVLVAYLTPSGCEIAAGSRAGVLVSRTVPAQEARMEILRTNSYLGRIGSPASVVLLGGGPRETLAEMAEELRSYGLQVQLRTREGDLPVGATLAEPGSPGFTLPVPEAPRFPLFQVAAAAAIAVILSAGLAASWQANVAADEVRRLETQRDLLAREIASRKPSPQVKEALTAVRKARLARDPFEEVRKVIPGGVWLETMRVDGNGLIMQGKSVSIVQIWRYAVDLGARVTSLRYLDQAVTVGGQEVPLFAFTIERREEKTPRTGTDQQQGGTGETQ